MKSIAEITKNMTDWQPPVIPENIAHGDMPGDKVEIGEDMCRKQMSFSKNYCQC